MEFFLGLVIFFVLLYYGFKLFLRYGLPWLIVHFLKKQQTKNGGFSGFGNTDPGFTEGEVHVTGLKNKKQKKDDNFGEYVDFEEVDE